MSNIVKFSESGVPAHIARMFEETANNDLSGGVSVGFPIISYKGKVWTIVEGGNRTMVHMPDDEDTPAAALEIVIVKGNPNISKTYYDGGYEEGSAEKPTCHSDDGKAPALDAQVPQAKSCAVCPRNVWGSRVTENGAKGKACSDLRRLCVVPGGELTKPMLLRVPAGSLKELVAYSDMLTKRKAPYQAVLTRVGFDHTVAHQKFTFKPLGWLSAEQLAQVTETAKLDVVNRILGLSPAVEDTGPATVEEDDPLGAPPAHVTGKPATAAPKKAAPAKGGITAEQVDAALEGKPIPKAPKLKTPSFSVVGKATEDEIEAALNPPTAAPKKAAAKAPTLLEEADSELDKALEHLDFEDV